MKEYNSENSISIKQAACMMGITTLAGGIIGVCLGIRLGYDIAERRCKENNQPAITTTEPARTQEGNLIKVVEKK